MQPASLVLAAVAAGCNAFSSVMQRRVNRGESERRRFSVALVLHLIGRPAWLLGLAAMLTSFLLQATALGLGTLAAVEPVLVLELPLTLLFAAWILNHRLHTRDWSSAAAMAIGLALFIAAIDPTGGHANDVHEAPVVLGTIATAAGVAVLAATAAFGPDRSRSALFGVAAGTGYGLSASLMKISVAHLSARGLSGLMTSWETYAMVACGVTSLVLVQAALHSGTLVAAQPGMTLMDPLVSVCWGVLLLGETTRTGPVLILAGIGGFVIVAAVLLLARSSFLAGEPDRQPTPQAASRSG